MIKAIVFDLDGTLVQTEILKARSYARAIADLSGKKVKEKEAIEAFKKVVGRSRKEVASFLMNEFDLESAATSQMKKFEVSQPWQAFVQMRLEIYQLFLDSPRILKKYLCPYNLELLKYAVNENFKTGLATMSHCAQTNRVLKMLGIRNLFDFVATADDVENGKPDPEIYLLMVQELQVEPEECLVVEDSLNGIKAALAAGTHPIAVVNDYTRSTVVASGILPQNELVIEPKNVMRAAIKVINEKNNE